MQPIKNISPIFLGCDPEFFFSRGGKIVGSEKLLPEDGLSGIRKFQEVNYMMERVNREVNVGGKIIVDGVQAELNPAPDTCRQNLSRNIGYCFLSIREKILKDKELSIDFSPTVLVTDEEFDSLKESSKVFGCAPSKNAHDTKASIKVNAAEYKHRSAGGHIHMGRYNSSIASKALDMPEKTVPMLDLLVGNTSVLIDRDPGNIERRKNYGRAGEYRTPDHGIEYRTLSNFWLKDYALMSFVFGLSRLAVNIVGYSDDTNNYCGELMSRVKIKNITKAINNNDFDLAYENFNKIKGLIDEITPVHAGYDTPLNKEYTPLFEHFLKQGTDFWFKDRDPVEYWIKRTQGGGIGWETFLKTTVAPHKKQSEIVESPFQEILELARETVV